jgi:hypothetical protein
VRNPGVSRASARQASPPAAGRGSRETTTRV